MIYLDNSATTRQYEEVTELLCHMGKEEFGNPSSLHTLGFAAANTLSAARAQVAAQLPPGGTVVFTSCGTESDNAAIFSAVRKRKRRGNRVITSQVEHPAVLEACRRLEEEGIEVIYLKPDEDGVVSLRELEEAVNEETILVTLMAVNNEVGAIEPVLPAADFLKAFNKRHGTEILLHTDAVQAFGKLALGNVPADMISLSGHKIHAPKGVGALFLRKGLTLPAHIVGGGQEGNLRSGTENTGGIAGFGLAAELAHKDRARKMRQMAEVSEYLRKGLMESLSEVRCNGPEASGESMTEYGKRCPSVLNLSFAGTRGEVLLHTLEQDGIFVSTGSACSSHKTGDSHVLRAMGRSHKEIEGAVRFSFSEFNTIAEMDEVIDRVTAAVKRFRRLGSFR